jgi:uncharacterized protein YidB (DUF937 family)
MSLFDDLANQANAALSGGSSPGLMTELSKLLGSKGGGGLADLLAQFQAKGHGDAVASWIGTGANLSISAEQIQAVMGNAQVAAIAQKLGLSPADASSAISKLLPQVVNQLSPQGKLPSDDLLQQGLAMLQSFGGKA